MVKEQIHAGVKALITAYIDVAPEDFSMTADLDLVYDMDSTEMTEFAKEIERQYGIPVSRTERQSWETAESIAEFVLAKLVADGVAA